MKFTLDRTTLIKTLQHTQSVVERKNAMPVLANVLIEAGNHTLKFTATDMELTVSDSVPMQIERAGTITAPAETLYDIAKRLPENAAVAFDYEDGSETLKIRAGKFKTDLTVLSADQFPAMTKGEVPYRFDMPAKVLAGMLSRVRFAMSTEETRYYLNGIYMHVPDGTGQIYAVATDGHRLARVAVEAPEGAQDMPGIILPRKAVTELLRLLDESEGVVSLALSDAKLQATLGGTMLTTRLIEGTFPDYKNVIPVDNHLVIKVEKEALASAVGRCAAISSDRARPVKFEMLENAMLISGQGDRGNAQEELTSDVVRYTGEAFSIGFQTRYVTDVLEELGEYVEMRAKDAQSPVLLADPGQTDALFLLMPMRV